MIHSSFTRHFACLSLIAALIAPGCSGDDKATSDTASTTNETTGTESDSATSTTSGTDSDTGTDSDSATTTTTTTTTDTTATTTTTTTGVDPQPDGAMCTADAECISGSCFLVPLLGGICGECKVDADCDGGGCTIPNPLANPPVGASCNMGEPGAGCMADGVCADPTAPFCGLVLDASPIIAVNTCSECKENADCTDPANPNCSPTISVAEFSGQLTCVPDGSVPNDSACNREEIDGVPIGNAACESGKCGTAVVMGVVQIGVCGECFTDDDCMGGTCQDAAVDTDTLALIGSKCM